MSRRDQQSGCAGRGRPARVPGFCCALSPAGRSTRRGCAGLLLAVALVCGGQTDLASENPSSETPQWTDADPQDVAEFVPGRLLVKFKAGVKEEKRQSIIKGRGARQTGRIDRIDVRILELPANASERAFEHAFKQRAEVEFAEVDRIRRIAAIPNDPKYWIQWHLPKIDAPTAWDITPGTEDVIIAVADTGVDASHPDLAAKMVPGRNVYNDSNDTTDMQAHGTPVAGVAAAAGNDGTGIASPAWYSRIMPIKVTDGSTNMASDSVISKGIIWAADHGARVFNASWALCHPSSALDSAAQYMWGKGGVVFFGAGNISTYCTSSDDPWIGLVSATDASDNFASFSAYGNPVDFAAPGVSLYTTMVGGGYTYGSGTSFSTPVVSGVAALVISANPRLTSQRIMDILQQSADDLGEPGWDPYYGWGRINAGRAVQMAGGLSPLPRDTRPPTVSFAAEPSAVSGEVLLSISAGDEVGVASVTLSVDGQLLGTDTTAPYEFYWDTAAEADGRHILTATARDAADNTASCYVVVSVSNTVADSSPPTVWFNSPAEGGTVAAAITVNISAADNVAIASVQLEADGVLVASDTAAPYSFGWDTTSRADGPCTLTAVATDTAGLSARVAISVDVENARPAQDTTAPAVTITSPAGGSTVSGNVNVSVDATDDRGVEKVELYVDGGLAAGSTTAPFTTKWNSRKAARGAHSLQCKAYDAAGNQGVSQTVTVYR